MRAEHRLSEQGGPNLVRNKRKKLRSFEFPLLKGNGNYETTVRPLLSGHPWDFAKWPLNRDGHLTEVQYKLDRKGSKHDFVAFIWQNALIKNDHI